MVPRQWKVIQHVREKFTCRPARRSPSRRPRPCDRRAALPAGPARHVLFEKYGQHQPLNRQSERYAREGIDLSVSTLADQVGAAAATLMPLTTR